MRGHFDWSFQVSSCTFKQVHVQSWNFLTFLKYKKQTFWKNLNYDFYATPLEGGTENIYFLNWLLVATHDLLKHIKMGLNPKECSFESPVGFCWFYQQGHTITVVYYISDFILLGIFKFLLVSHWWGIVAISRYPGM